MSDRNDEAVFAIGRVGQQVVTAPDGLRVHELLAVAGASMAVFELSGGAGRAVCHRDLDEIWLVLEGMGELWRECGERERVDRLEPGTCAAILRGTRFQVRADPGPPLRIAATTTPAWPGDQAVTVVAGRWPPTVAS